MTKPKLIVADDDSGIRTFVRNVAEDMGYEVGEAANGREYLDLFGDKPAGVIVLDITMPEEHGTGLFDFIHDYHQEAQIIMITGHSETYLSAAMRLGAEKGLNMIGGLNKPIKLDDLENLLKGAMASYKDG